MLDQKSSDYLEIMDLSGDGGVLKELVFQGTGNETPSFGSIVSIHYTGSLLDGTIFDCSITRGEPFEFILGKGQVIKAFDIGVGSMKSQEICVLKCRPEYGLVTFGDPSIIPPNAILIFKLQLLGWKGEDLSPTNDNSIERFIIERSIRKKKPSEGALVKVHIVGKYDERIFEDRIIGFDYGEGSNFGIVEGVEITLAKMSVGETSRVKIKAKYAFGAKGDKNLNIPSNASVEYVIKLMECEKGTEEWKLNDVDRMEQATIFNGKGKSYFKEDNFLLAIKMYKRSFDILPEKNDDDVLKMKIAAKLNIALCYQKLNENFDAKSECNYALTLDSSNIKALYRRGQCNLAISEINEAVADFEKVLELQPSNKAAANKIIICKQKMKHSENREKQIYANMFAKFAVADKQKTICNYDAEDDILSKCGEWTEEDAKREADLAFERDNNIVMI